MAVSRIISFLVLLFHVMAQSVQSSVYRTETIIENAISVGAPLYNEGDIEGCANIYMAAALTIVSNRLFGAKIIVTAYSTALGQSDRKAAWTLRNAFDFVSDTINNLPDPLPSMATTPEREPMAWDYDMSQLRWVVSNDVVMGGESSSQVSAVNGMIDFNGYVTTASNGGFATAKGSSRSELDLSRCTGVAFQAKGDNVRFKFSVSNKGDGWFAKEYETSFKPNAEWQTFTVSFNELKGVFMGQRRAGKVNPAAISGFRLMRSAFANGLNKDPEFKNGNFQLQVRGLKCV